MLFSGESFLREKPSVKAFNLRASYNDEAQEQIKYLVEEHKHTKIGLFIQADEFGLYVESGLREALAKYNLTPAIVARYKRNSQEVESALNTLKLSGVTAICLVGTYEPLSEFINSAQKQGFNPEYTSVSFVPSFDLFDEVNSPSNIMVTEIVPNPLNCNDNFFTEFSADMQASNIKKPSRLHFEGYINAMAFSKAEDIKPLDKLTEIGFDIDPQTRNMMHGLIKLADKHSVLIDPSAKFKPKELQASNNTQEQETEAYGLF